MQKNISGNYIMMSQPYIGLFTDGAEQWCQKLRLGARQFTDTEKIYYTARPFQVLCKLKKLI